MQGAFSGILREFTDYFQARMTGFLEKNDGIFQKTAAL
jgi:hypothetical protein